MELRHFRYFVGVAEAGSFTRAAQILNTVQSSLSRQIQDLEREVGTKLLERDSRNMELTPAGAAFLNEARLVLAQSHRAVERARQVARASAGRLTVGFVPGVEIDMLAGVMTALHNDLKSVELVIYSRASPDLIRSLHERQIDAAFIRPGDDSRGLEVHVLRREHLLAAIPATHPLARAKHLKPEALSGESFIIAAADHAPVVHKAVSDFLRKHQLVPQQFYEAENLATAFSLIVSIGGISLLPEFAFQFCPPTVVSVPLTADTPTIELALAYHPENHSTVLQGFVRHFLQAAQSH
jgi:LysR family hca operon transcriptional activator